MYFQFCGWRHIFIDLPWANWARIKHDVIFRRSSLGGVTSWTSDNYSVWSSWWECALGRSLLSTISLLSIMLVFCDVCIGKSDDRFAGHIGTPMRAVVARDRGVWPNVLWAWLQRSEVTCHGTMPLQVPVVLLRALQDVREIRGRVHVQVVATPGERSYTNRSTCFSVRHSHR